MSSHFYLLGWVPARIESRSWWGAHADRILSVARFSDWFLAQGVQLAAAQALVRDRGAELEARELEIRQLQVGRRTVVGNRCQWRRGGPVIRSKGWAEQLDS